MQSLNSSGMVDFRGRTEDLPGAATLGEQARHATAPQENIRKLEYDVLKIHGSFI